MFPKSAGRLTETTQYAYLQYLTSVNPVDWVDRGLAYGGSCLSKDEVSCRPTQIPVSAYAGFGVGRDGKNSLKRFSETDKDFLKIG